MADGPSVIRRTVLRSVLGPSTAPPCVGRRAPLLRMEAVCDWDEFRSAGLLTRACENLIGGNAPQEVLLPPYSNGKLPRPHSPSPPCSAFADPDGSRILTARNPEALIQASDGNFYGTTDGGGAGGSGTVFKITPGGTLTALYNFCA
jgi:uncharacterized repeat protein (TIGR03803 family)